MELLVDDVQMEARFGSFGDCVSVGSLGGSISVGARLVHGLRQTYHRLKNKFGCTRCYC
jgi:hypothetical protein